MHFMRDKTTAKGGPDGGDGGRGGNIVLRGSKNIWTLLHLKYQRHIIARGGEPGEATTNTVRTVRMSSSKFPLGQWSVIRKPERSSSRSTK